MRRSRVRHRFTLRVTGPVYTKLAQLAAQRGIPTADLARTCLLSGLDQLAHGHLPQRKDELRWEQATQEIATLLRQKGQAGYRTALLRRLAGLSVDRWEELDAWMEERAAGAPTRSAPLLAKEALVRFGLPAKIMPALVAVAQRVRHRLYMRAARQPN